MDTKEIGALLRKAAREPDDGLAQASYWEARRGMPTRFSPLDFANLGRSTGQAAQSVLYRFGHLDGLSCPLRTPFPVGVTWSLHQWSRSYAGITQRTMGLSFDDALRRGREESQRVGKGRGMNMTFALLPDSSPYRRQSDEPARERRAREWYYLAACWSIDTDYDPRSPGRTARRRFPFRHNRVNPEGKYDFDLSSYLRTDRPHIVAERMWRRYSALLEGRPWWQPVTTPTPRAYSLYDERRHSGRRTSILHLSPVDAFGTRSDWPVMLCGAQAHRGSWAQVVSPAAHHAPLLCHVCRSLLPPNHLPLPWEGTPQKEHVDDALPPTPRQHSPGGHRRRAQPADTDAVERAAVG